MIELKEIDADEINLRIFLEKRKKPIKVELYISNSSMCC